MRRPAAVKFDSDLAELEHVGARAGNVPASQTRSLVRRARRANRRSPPRTLENRGKVIAAIADDVPAIAPAASPNKLAEVAGGKASWENGTTTAQQPTGVASGVTAISAPPVGRW